MSFCLSVEATDGRRLPVARRGLVSRYHIASVFGKLARTELGPMYIRLGLSYDLVDSN